MANTLLTVSQITKAAVPLFINSNAFLGNINRQYSDQFAREGAKIGATLNIRRPSRYVVSNGPALSLQDNVQTTTPLVVSTQRHIDISFTSVEQSLQLDEFEELVLRPAMNTLAATVAQDVMSIATTSPNMVGQGVTAGVGTLVSPTALTFNQARAAIMLNSAPPANICAIMDLTTDVRMSTAIQGLFNPTGRISAAFDTGEVRGPALGIATWMSDPTVTVRAAGTYTTMPTVNGAGQTGSVINVTAGTGVALLIGDIVTFPGVNAVNPLTGQTTGQVRQFALTAPYNNTATMSIYPSLIPAVIVGGLNTVQGATCTASPTTTNVVGAGLASGITTRRNIVYHPQSFTLATADLPVYGNGIVSGARENFGGISLRTLQFYDGTNDRLITRIDMLYGFAQLVPEWSCVVPDIQ